MAARFNTMLDTLEGSVEAQKRLVADASHELRTPVTSLRTNIEVLLAGDDLPESARRRLLEDVREQTEELSGLITDVIELARGEVALSGTEDVRLDEIVSVTAGRVGRSYPDARFALDLEPTVVEGLPDRLARAVGNLLDNAAKYGPPGGVVEVTLRDGELAVRDHGPGVAAADAPFVFDRFYRGEGARGRHGSGLGLAIVRQVAESHGGSVRVAEAAGGGAEFRLALPSALSVPAGAGAT
jgi:two-component system sensor histidine kinase MprB